MKKVMFFIPVVITLFLSCSENEDSGLPVTTGEGLQLTRTEIKLVQSGNQFALNLYKQLSQDFSRENIILSPLGVSMVFSMLNNGAAGTTRQELQQVLGFEKQSPETINNFYKKMLDGATQLDPEVISKFANSLWLAENFPLKPTFVATNKTYYEAELRNVDFTLPATRLTINQWVENKTNGKITDFFDEIDPATRLILLNAIYFRGTWSDPFDVKYSYDEPFRSADGSIVQAEMMNKETAMDYKKYDEYTIASLPYGNGTFCMTFILPAANRSLPSVVDLPELSRALETPVSYDVTVDLKLPRFKIESEHNLEEILKAMGMETVLSGSADFSAVSEVPLLVSKVKQKAFIQVNEDGAEATAATSIQMEELLGEDTPPVPTLYLNKPFLFMIRERNTGAIYFIGHIFQF